MTPAHAEFVRVGSLRLRVRTRGSGEGPPLLLLNGIGASLEMWEPLVGELGDVELITFDLPGCGRSSTAERPMKMHALADLVDELLRALGRRRVDVLGYSFGGLVAQELAYRHPHRVDRLILCATTPGLPSLPPRPLAAWMMLTPARYRDRRVAERAVPTIAGGRTRRDPKVLGAELDRRLREAPSTRGYAHQLYATVGWSSHPWLRRLRQETLVLQGDDDPLVPVTNARYLARAIPHARLAVLHGAGHLMLLDEPAAAAAHIRAFLGRPVDRDRNGP